MCMMALGLIGGILSAVGSIAAGQAQASAANAQAAAYQQKAQAERQAAEFNAGRQREKSIRIMSGQRAGYLASGIDPGSGSPLDLIADTARESELDVAAIKFNGELKARDFENQSAVFRQKADAASVGGFFGAISPLIRGFGGAGGGSSSFSFDTAGSDEG